MIDISNLKAAPGLPLYEGMKAGFDYDPVVRTAVDECNVPDAATARYLLDAFLQWIAALPGKAEGQMYVMLKCDVDRIFHAFVLNSALYREFCNEYMKHFIDHNPLDGRGSRRAVEYTVAYLGHTYGDRLHPELAKWAGMLDVNAWRVSCGDC